MLSSGCQIFFLLLICQILPYTVGDTQIFVEYELCSAREDAGWQNVTTVGILKAHVCRVKVKQGDLCFANHAVLQNFCRLRKCSKNMKHYTTYCKKDELSKALEVSNVADQSGFFGSELEPGVDAVHSKTPVCLEKYEKKVPTFENKGEVVCKTKENGKLICYLHFEYVACRLAKCPRVADLKYELGQCEEGFLKDVVDTTKFAVCEDTKPGKNEVFCLGEGQTGCYIFNERTSQIRCRFSGLCDDGERPKKCSALETWKACASNPCKNGATCVDKKGGEHVCVCEDVGKDPEAECKDSCKYPFWGQGCKEEVGACGTAGLSNVADATDMFDPSTGCKQCADGFTKPPYCKKADCKKVICRHNGECRNQTCQCAVGWKGAMCEVEDALQLVRLTPCSNDWCNGEYCYYVDNKPTCRCGDTKAGKRCQFSCQPRTEVCQHGECVDDKCSCDRGFRGKQCHKRCKDGTYGDCKEKCGNCIVYPCDYVSGHCKASSDGRVCTANYKPPLCTVWDNTKNTDDTPFRGQFDVNTPWTSAYNVRTSDEYKALATVTENYLDGLEALDDVASEVPDVTFSPAAGGKKGRRRRRQQPQQWWRETAIRDVMSYNITRETRQAGQDLGVRAQFVLLVTNKNIGDDFAAKLTASIRDNADQFDKTGKYQMDQSSVRLTAVSVSGAAPTSSRLDVAPVAVVVMVIAIAGVLLLVAIRRRKVNSSKNRRMLQEQNFQQTRLVLNSMVQTMNQQSKAQSSTRKYPASTQQEKRSSRV